MAGAMTPSRNLQILFALGASAVLTFAAPLHLAAQTKLRVLYMEATGDSEIFYLKHALEDEPGIEVKALFYGQRGASTGRAVDQMIRLDQRNGDKLYHVQHSRHGYPQTLEQLLRYDVVIWSDVARTAFTPEQMSNTVRFVKEHGGGFVMIGGETSFGSGFYDQTPIDEIVPVEMGKSRDNFDGEFRVVIPEEAFNHAIFKLVPDAAENKAAWENLPPFFGFNRVDRPKHGATVLWAHPFEGTGEGPRVVLAVQQVGKGRSMAFTTDTTAAWGRMFERMWGDDAQYYKKFWGNSVRWLAGNRDRPK